MKNEEKLQEFKVKFGKIISKYLRKYKTIKLCKSLNVSQYTVEAWKKGKRVPHLYQFVELCKLIEKPPGVILKKVGEYNGNAL